jgi:EmrB/QacA subfamily drug resistance transporter
MVERMRRGAGPRWTLAALCLSLVIVSLDATIVNVALPRISGDLRASTTQLQWVADAYSVVFAGLLLLAGAIGDRAGHKRVLTAGLVVFGAGSALAALSPSAGFLIAMRAVMGLGGALIMSASLAALTAAFPGERRAFAIGFWSAAAGAGVAGGPVAGGALLTRWSWQSVFLVNVPLVIIALAADALVIPETPRQHRVFDVTGAVLWTVAVVTVIAAVIESSAWGWSSPRTALLAAAGAASAVLFTVHERRARAGVVDLSWFRDRRLTIACVVAAVLFFAMTGSSFILMQYLQLVLGYSPLTAGAAVLPIVGLTMVFAPLSGALVHTLGARTLMTVGMLFLAGGLALLATLTTHTAYWHILIAGSLFGIGIGVTLTPASDAVMGSRAAQRPGVASGINDTVQELGSAFGVAILGTVVAEHFAAGLTHQPASVTGNAGSLAMALGAARHLAPAGIAQVRASFTHAMDLALLVAAGTSAAAALVALLGMTRHTRAVSPGRPP